MIVSPAEFEPNLEVSLLIKPAVSELVKMPIHHKSVFLRVKALVGPFNVEKSQGDFVFREISLPPLVK